MWGIILYAQSRFCVAEQIMVCQFYFAPAYKVRKFIVYYSILLRIASVSKQIPLIYGCPVIRDVR